MRLSDPRRSDSGDTIIEVIFAVVIFALVAVSSLSIMNKGVVLAERSLETTLVSQQIDAQAEALRYIHDLQFSAVPDTATTWSDLITTYGRPSASTYGTPGNTCVLPSGSYKPFVLNALKPETPPALPSMTPGAGQPPYAQVIYNPDSSIQSAYGLWIEAVPSGMVNQTRFVDFHIRACWDGPGSSVPMTLGTIVRLYDPR